MEMIDEDEYEKDDSEKEDQSVEVKLWLALKVN